MSVPNTPSPRQPPSAAVTILVLIGGLLMLAPGVCALSFIQEYTSPSSLYPAPTSFIVLWVISFIISALGIALIVYAFRRYRTSRTP
jgi:biotin transporter BioY